MSADRDLAFVDTNVLVYLHDASAGRKRGRARELVEKLWSEGSGCLSLQVLQELYVDLTQKVPKPLPPDTARQVISELESWTIHCPGVEDVSSAIRIQQDHRISFWDALIIQSAGALGCRVIWTEDLDSGQLYEGIEVADPFGDAP